MWSSPHRLFRRMRDAASCSDKAFFTPSVASLAARHLAAKASFNLTNCTNPFTTAVSAPEDDSTSRTTSASSFGNSPTATI